jgi:hypothetical protein
VLFVLATGAGVVVALALFAITLPLVPFGLLANVLRRRSHA